MPNVIRNFQLALWIISFWCHFSCLTALAQNSSNSTSTSQMGSRTLQAQEKKRGDVDAVLSSRLHELFGTPSGEKPNFGRDFSMTSSNLGAVYTKGTAADQAGMPGDVGKGVILLEEKDTLYLGVHPCKNGVVPFHNPYVKERVGSVTCNGKNLDMYLVTQH